MSTLNKLLSTWLILLLVNIFSSHGAPTSETADESVKIIGGVPASPGEFPYIVSIRNKGDSSHFHACGGTLVTMSAVVTGHHCIELFRVRDLLVVAGAYFLEEAQNGIQQTRTVSRISKYPGYTTYDHDVVVLHLSTPFIGNASVGTLPLPSRNQGSSGTCEIAGWGYTEGNSDLSEELRKGNITVNSKDVCARVYGENYDREYQLCVGRMNGETVSPCIGDTGGPLVCKYSNGTKYFAGITSWGNGCQTLGYPTVCMEISRYRDWLDSTISNAATTTTTTTTTTKSPKSLYSEEEDISSVIEKNSHSNSPCSDSSSKN